MFFSTEFCSSNVCHSGFYLLRVCLAHHSLLFLMMNSYIFFYSNVISCSSLYLFGNRTIEQNRNKIIVDSIKTITTEHEFVCYVTIYHQWHISISYSNLNVRVKILILLNLSIDNIVYNCFIISLILFMNLILI